MNRSIERWQLCNPSRMATEQSDAAITYAIEDARHDILELYDQLKRFKQIAKNIAYPCRGSIEEGMTLQNFADLIQSAYTAEQLEE